MGNTKLRGWTLRALAAALLAVALAAGVAVLSAPQRALADPATGQTFTVKTSGAETYAVSAYMLFTAEVDNTTNAAKNVSWNTAYESTVKSFLDDSTNGASQTYSNWLSANGLTDSANNALTYISEEIGNSSSIGSVGGPATAASSFSTKLAKLVSQQTATTGPQNVTAGAPVTFSSLTEGYYLFYADNQPPMWTPVGGNTTEGTIKDPVYLTAEKTVQLKDGTWGVITDASNGQDVKFRVKGEAPNSVPTSAFKYNLTDTLPIGLTPSMANVRVYAYDGTTETDITSYFTANVSGQVLTVTCTDLYSSTGAQAGLMTGGTVTDIIFEYTATLNSNATLGTTYNENTAQIAYGTATSGYQTDEVSAKVTTYQLEVVKTDSADASKRLQDAEFTLSTVINGTTYYVQGDGTLSTTAYTFKTNSSGVFDVTHIAAGTYKLTETAAPSGYKLPTVVDTNITITATLNQTKGELDDLSVTADNGAKATPTVSSGKVEIVIADDPTTVLPITGMTPNQLGTVIGVLLVAAGVVALVVRARRKAQA